MKNYSIFSSANTRVLLGAPCKLLLHVYLFKFSKKKKNHFLQCTGCFWSKKKITSVNDVLVMKYFISDIKQQETIQNCSLIFWWLCHTRTEVFKKIYCWSWRFLINLYIFRGQIRHSCIALCVESAFCGGC